MYQALSLAWEMGVKETHQLPLAGNPHAGEEKHVIDQPVKKDYFGASKWGALAREGLSA